MKTILSAIINIDGFLTFVSCKESKKGYQWYYGERAVTSLPSKTINEAKEALLITYPPEMYRITADWL